MLSRGVHRRDNQQERRTKRKDFGPGLGGLGDVAAERHLNRLHGSQSTDEPETNSNFWGFAEYIQLGKDKQHA
jgi:hypothetical protein